MRYVDKVKKIIKQLYRCNLRYEVPVADFVKNIALSDILIERINRANTNLSQLRVDIYIPNVVAVEVHGEQHAKPVKFSYDILDTDAAFERRKLLDQIKQDTLYEAGVPLVCVWYDEIKGLTPELFYEKVKYAQSLVANKPIHKCITVEKPPEKVSKTGFRRNKQYAESKESRIKRLAAARAAAKTKYQRARAFKARNAK